MGTDETSQARYKFHKKYLSNIKVIFLFVYIVVNPIIDTPEWCIDYYRKEGKFVNRWSFTLDCEVVDIPYSKNPSLNPYFIAILDFACLFFFLFFRWFKTRWETNSKRKLLKKRNLILAIAVGVILIDYVICFIFFTRPVLSIFLRPIVFACFLRQVRLNSKNFYGDLKDTGVTIFAMFLFIAWFAAIGIYLFRYSLEGYTMFDGIHEANFNLIILVTTANFPDIMLPAYE